MFTKKLIVLLLFLSCNVSAANKITAQSWLVTNEAGRIIQGKNYDVVRSIASITKLMTVMVVLDAKQDLNEKLTHNHFTREELIDLALVKSDNAAAKQLCEYYPGGTYSCIHAMNKKAFDLGMIQTKFIEPTGLSPMNISTGQELITLVLEAKNYPEIVNASKISDLKIKARKKYLFFKNTNPKVGKNHKIIVSKTGWTKASGGCIVLFLDSDVGKRVVIVLGSKNTQTRIPEAEFISTMKAITY